MHLIHLNQHFIVVDKPAGISVLNEGWNPDAPFLLKLLESDYGKVWIVHRLDKLTSGVMVFARTGDSHRSLSIQFEKHRVEKVYHAISIGVPMWDEKNSGHPLRVNVGHKHRTVVDYGKGKSANTLFKVLKRFPAHALLEARPLTGRTHQVRVHAFALGFPLLGDQLYGPAASEIINRPALHACSLTIQQPLLGDWSLDLDHERDWQPVTYTAEYPDDFKIALLALSNTRNRVGIDKPESTI